MDNKNKQYSSGQTECRELGIPSLEIIFTLLLLGFFLLSKRTLKSYKGRTVDPFTMGLVERVAVIFFNIDNIPLERFIFKFTVNQSCGSKVEEDDLEFSLRSFLVKLFVSEGLTKVLPRDCRWEITAYFRSLPCVSTSKGAELWIPTDTKQWQQPPLITPIKPMSGEPLFMQLYLEHPSLSEPIPQEGKN